MQKLVQELVQKMCRVLAACSVIVSVPAAAQRDHATDTAAVGRNHPVAHECAHPHSAWLFCDDFDQDRLHHYFEYTDRGGSFRRIAGVGLFGSPAMLAHFDRGQTDAGALKLALGKTPASYVKAADSGTAVYRELYWRLYLRVDSTWMGGGGDKLSRVVILSDSNWAQALAAHVWSGRDGTSKNYLLLDPASGTSEAGALVTTHYNDFEHLRWLGSQQGATPIFDAAHAGQWYCVEAHVRLNDADRANGIFELWIDDQLDARREGLNWVGRYSEYGLNAIFLENYWNDGAVAAQSRTIDNFVVSTARIGCGRR